MSGAGLATVALFGWLRTALARALVKRPHLLLLDEPLSNLDAALLPSIRTEISRIQPELGVTTTLAPHDQIKPTTIAGLIVLLDVRPD